MAFKKKKITCIICPMSCIIEVDYTKKVIKKIQGYQCNKGKVYAREELYDPKRTVTSTIKVNGGALSLVSVRTTESVPKNLIFPIINELSRLNLEAPVKIGDIIIKNIQGTGVNIIATKTVDKVSI